MASFYDELDLAFAWNGDFLLSESKDLKDTSEDGLQSLRQQIHSVCASSFGDWEIYPNRGASLDDFIGEPNTRSIGEAIHDRVRLALTSAGLVIDEDLEVRVVPVHIHKMLIVIRIDTLPTPFNKLTDGQTLQVALVFDTIEQGIFSLNKTPNFLSL